MIKTVFFDFDGVLTIDGSGSFTTCTHIQKHTPDVSFEKVLRCYRVPHPKLLLGQTTHKDIWKDFCTCIGHDLPFTVLEESFRATPMNAEMMKLCKGLHGTYRLGIITDNSKDRLAMLRKELKLDELFDVIIVSGETGERKDSEANFRKAAELAGCTPEECVFIDNNQQNLETPKRLGWNTIHHDDKKNDVRLLRRELEKVGVSAV